MATSTNRQRDSFNEINITPLTDIFLVLLVIMMVIAPLLDKEGLKLIVPNYQEKTQNQPDAKIINVNVSNEGKYTVDGNAVEESNLLQAITQDFKTKKDGLMIHASGDATHGAVVKVMDSARNVGIKSISLSN